MTSTVNRLSLRDWWRIGAPFLGWGTPVPVSTTLGSGDNITGGTLASGI